MLASLRLLHHLQDDCRDGYRDGCILSRFIARLATLSHTFNGRLGSSEAQSHILVPALAKFTGHTFGGLAKPAFAVTTVK
jgi:hypothetical protein